MASPLSNNESAETRQERREKRLKKKQERMAQHGKGLAKIYKVAVEKRAKETK